MDTIQGNSIEEAVTLGGALDQVEQVGFALFMVEDQTVIAFPLNLNLIDLVGDLVKLGDGVMP